MLLLLAHGPYFENSCSQVKLLRLEWADLCPGEMEFGNMWNLKICYKSTYLQNRTMVTNVENKLMVPKEEGGEG